MIVPSPMDPRESEIDPGNYFATLRKVWLKAVFLSSVGGLATLLYLFTKPNIYQATTDNTPSIDGKKQNPALGTLSAFGVSIGGPTSVKGLESLFKSNDLTVRVFRKYHLWPIVLADKFDSATGKVRLVLTDRLIVNEKGPKPPASGTPSA